MTGPKYKDNFIINDYMFSARSFFKAYPKSIPPIKLNFKVVIPAFHRRSSQPQLAHCQTLLFHIHRHKAVSRNRQLMLRVVRCLPLIAALPGASRTLRAGVGQASREETAGYNKAARIGDRLWRFEWLTCLCHAKQVDLIDYEIVQASHYEAYAFGFSLR